MAKSRLGENQFKAVLETENLPKTLDDQYFAILLNKRNGNYIDDGKHWLQDSLKY